MKKIFIFSLVSLIFLSGCSVGQMAEPDKQYFLSSEELSELGINIENKCSFRKNISDKGELKENINKQSCGFKPSESNQDKLEVKITEFIGDANEIEKAIAPFVGATKPEDWDFGERGSITIGEPSGSKSINVYGRVKKSDFLVRVRFTPEVYQENSKEIVKNLLKRIVLKLP